MLYFSLLSPIPHLFNSYKLFIFFPFFFPSRQPHLNNFVVLQTKLSRFFLLNYSDFSQVAVWKNCELIPIEDDNLNQEDCDTTALYFYLNPEEKITLNKWILEISGNIGIHRRRGGIWWDWRCSDTFQLTFLEMCTYSPWNSVCVLRHRVGIPAVGAEFAHPCWRTDWITSMPKNWVCMTTLRNGVCTSVQRHWVCMSRSQHLVVRSTLRHWVVCPP